MLIAERRSCLDHSIAELDIDRTPMIRLSVNVNKVATLRNSRGGREPSVLEAVERLRRGRRAWHHRASARRSAPHHAGRCARRSRGRCASHAPAVEFNIEGDPRPELLELVDEVRPDQCTLVPVVPGEITSQAGWQPGRDDRAPAGRSSAVCKRAACASACSSMPTPEPIRWAASIGADRVELYTEPFARAFEQGRRRGRRVVRAVRRGGRAGARARPRRQRRPRPRSREPRRCSATCRTSTRSRSATPSCRARCSSACDASSASIWPVLVGGRADADGAIRYDRIVHHEI